MAKSTYQEQAENLNKAIDIAISVIRKHPPKGFSEAHVQQFLNVYLDAKNKSLNPQAEHRNVKSLKFIVDEVFTFFQEGSGEAVNLFWGKVKEQGLPYQRKNKLTKIIKRKKIKNQVEYDFVIDVINPYMTEGLINKEEVTLLNKLIEEYEKK